MNTTNSEAMDTLVSRDGVPIGPILGIHRDPVSRTALWAVVEGPQRQLLVPMAGAKPESGTVRAGFDADRVLSSPSVTDPTRLWAPDEDRLRQHYAAASAPGIHGGGDTSGGVEGATGDGSSDVSVIRSEERLEVRTLEWRPYQRVRLRTVIRSREETHVVRVHWEELVVENEPVSTVERLEVSAGLSQPDTADVELVLHREEVAVTTRVVPYEWVRATRSPVVEELQVNDTVRKEQIDIEHEHLEPNGGGAESRRAAKR